ncbi:MAG: MaoC family dehydratase [Candidatus Zixiibacteriota bacterium]
MDIDNTLKIGDSAEYSKTITESDIYQFAAITGDYNPVHVDELYAQKTRFKTRIAHGLLTAGLISTVLANKLPGPGTIYLKQELNFYAPVHIGDTITARVEIAAIDTKMNRVHLRTICRNQHAVIVLDGEAVVKIPT